VSWGVWNIKRERYKKEQCSRALGWKKENHPLKERGKGRGHPHGWKHVAVRGRPWRRGKEKNSKYQGKKCGQKGGNLHALECRSLTASKSKITTTQEH